MKAALMLAVALAAVPVPAQAIEPGVAMAVCEVNMRGKLAGKPGFLAFYAEREKLSLQDRQTLAAVCAIFEQGAMAMLRAIQDAGEPGA